MDLGGWRTASRLVMLVGAAVGILGIITFVRFSEIAGILLIISAVVIVVIAASISGFLSTYDFHESVELAARKNSRKKE